MARLYHAGTQNQMTALLGGIDIAAHDAMGKLLNLSVAELIGGRLRERVPVYASGGYFTAADDQDAALAQQLEASATRGFGAFKIKIGRGPAEDVARCKLARRIIGDTPLLTVDTNGNYTEDGVLESIAAPPAVTSIGTRNRWRHRIGPVIAAWPRARRCGWQPARRCTPRSTSAG